MSTTDPQPAADVATRAPALPQHSPAVGANPRLLHCARCWEPLGLVLLGRDSRVERRCRKCKSTSAQLGMRDSFVVTVADAGVLPAACCIQCFDCRRVLGKALLGPGSLYQPRCRHCHKTTAVLGPFPVPSST